MEKLITYVLGGLFTMLLLVLLVNLFFEVGYKIESEKRKQIYFEQCLKAKKSDCYTHSIMMDN